MEEPESSPAHLFTAPPIRHEYEWVYSPSDFFPETRREKTLGCDVVIGFGTVTAHGPVAPFDSTTDLLNLLSVAVTARFEVQRWRRQGTPFSLSEGMLTTHLSNGQRVKYLSAHLTASFTVSVDIQVVRDGKVVSDSAEDRREAEAAFQARKQELVSLDGKIAEALYAFYIESEPSMLVDALLASHYAAAADPHNELVHLYELREAVSQELGGNARALKALELSKREWNRFGQLSNDMPIVEGRHRGKFVGKLRPATEEELVEARTFARTLFLRYLNLSPVMRKSHSGLSHESPPDDQTTSANNQSPARSRKERQRRDRKP